MEIICGIYKITNLINNKVYIGQSVNVLKRFAAHKNRPFNPKSRQYESYFYRAIRKYGLENFKFEVIEKCKKEELNKKEKEYISFYHSNDKDFGYNLTKGGESPTYVKLTEEEIEKIYCLLLTTNLSEEEIGKKFYVNQRTISYINQREVWRKDNISYPIRKEKIKNQLKFYCKNCGSEITEHSKTGLCYSCYVKTIETKRPSKEDLLKILEENNGNFLQIGKYFKVSDNTVRNWCKYYQLPFHSTDYKKVPLA